jgi:antirestriction protein
MLEIKGYITNLGKYNEGELIGEWISFPITKEELNEVFERIGIDGVNYEEYFFTDWETDIDNSNFGEYESISEMNGLAEQLADWDEDVIMAATSVWSIEEILEHECDDYMLLPDVHTDYDLGYYWIEESGCYDLSNMGNLSNYIDYKAFGRDVRLESNGGYTAYGYVECIA